jgi:hypothetical protein
MEGRDLVTPNRASFAAGWPIDSIEPATIELTWAFGGAHAWQVAATRI